jgi:hypothetical protein
VVFNKDDSGEGETCKKKQRKRYNIEQYQCEKENTRSNYIILYSMIDIIIMSSWSCVYTHTLREYRVHTYVVIIYYIHVFFFLLNSYRYSCVHTFNVVAVWTVFMY